MRLEVADAHNRRLSRKPVSFPVLVEFLCERNADTINKATSIGLFSNKKAYSYNLSCADKTDFFGFSFRINRSEDVSKAEFKPYDGKTKNMNELDTPVFTLKTKVSGKVMEVSSFKGNPQHFIAEGTTMKLTEVKLDSPEGSMDEFRIIAGEGKASFSLNKAIKGYEGTVTWSFRERHKIGKEL